MLRKLITLSLVAAFLVAAVAVDAFARAEWDAHRTEIAERFGSQVTSYSFPKIRHQPIRMGEPVGQEMYFGTNPNSRRQSLGTSQNVESPGFVVDNSWNDDQMIPGGPRQVDFRNTPAIHFVYGDAGSADVTSRYGYNVYDPTGGGSWPRGAAVGCEVQPSDQEGLGVTMDVDNRGFVILSGTDDAGGSQDNHYYSQVAEFSCFWGAGSQIPPSQYDVGFLDATSYLNQPRTELQYVGADTIWHIIAVENQRTTVQPGSPFDLDMNTLNYFRREGTILNAGLTWTGPVVLDSMNESSGLQPIHNGSIAASRVSANVAVGYTHFHAQAFVHNQRYDVEIYYQNSSDAGVTWSGPINITNYSRIDASQTGFLETVSLYDSEDFLHIVFTAGDVVEDVYNDPIYFWGDFSQSIYHWSNRTPGPNAGGTIVRAHNADWGIDLNTAVCGMCGPGTGYIGYASLSECNNRLYIAFQQCQDHFNNWGIVAGGFIDDCASGGFSDRPFAGNNEIGLTVSSSLDGLLWDAARNLTKTYTPDCDSAGFGGVCMNDVRPTLARYGYDSASFGEALTFPGSDLVVPDNGTGGAGNYLHMFYTEDHFPSPGYRDEALYGTKTNNPLKWMRIPCVEPIPAAQMRLSEDVVGYPDYVQHGQSATLTVTVTNDGNVPLVVDSLVGVEDSGPTGWLNTSVTSMNVDAGVNNTGTFDILINDGGLVNSPGTIVALNGSVNLFSNAANVDTGIVAIVNYLVADTVIGLAFDTVSTFDVSLLVTSTGEMGYNGNSNDGGLNLDFTQNGGECNPSTTDPNTAVYLYSGGPLVLRNDGNGEYTFNYATFQQEFSTDRSFRRVTDGRTHQDSTGSNFDGFFTGTMVNFDTSIAVERTYYAPTANESFVIVKTDYWAIDGGSVAGLAIGEFIDWDIPSDDGATNVSGSLPAYNSVYQQGYDTASTLPCVLNDSRYGAAQLLGYYTSGEFNSDSCANTDTPHGMYSWRNDSLFAVDDTLEADYFWNRMATTGLSVEAEATDLHSVLTVLHDYTLPAAETLTVYSVVTTVYSGTDADVSSNLDAAFAWYRDNLRPGCTALGGCCVGIRGNADGDGGDVVDVGDLTYLIGFLFLSGPAPDCPEEGNVDGAGATDVGDLTALIGFLFLGGTPPADC